MRVKFLGILFLIFYFFSLRGMHPLCAITTYQKAGRLGDRLYMYIQAKCIEEMYKIPFFLRPFKRSEEFVFYDLEEKLTTELEKKFDETRIISNQSEITNNPNKSILYMVTAKTIINWKYFRQNKDLVNKIRKLVAPKKKLPEFKMLTEGYSTIAVHVRRGGGYDEPLLSKRENIYRYSDQRFPLKFPPHEYYIEQIKTISKIFPNQKLYIHIFTDDKNPEEIAKKYQQEINSNNIVFNYRESGNYHDKNVIEDLFGMMKFDCLIRPHSHFSMIAEILGDYKIVISPKGYKWIGNKLIIDQVYVSDLR